MAFVFGSFAASLGGKNRFRLGHTRSTHWVPAILLAPLAVSTSPVNFFNWWTTCHPPRPPHPPQTSCVASNMCASARNVIIPPPTQPRPVALHPTCVQVQGMLSSPPPPSPDQLRCIQHVCKCKECYHPPPPTPDQLRSIQHVCKCKECYHPPSHPPQTSCVASNMCASARNVIIPPTPRCHKMRSTLKICTKAHGSHNYQPQLVNAGFLPSTVCKYIRSMMDSTLNSYWFKGCEACQPCGHWAGRTSGVLAMPCCHRVLFLEALGL